MKETKVEAGFTKKVNHIRHELCECGNHPTSLPCARGFGAPPEMKIHTKDSNCRLAHPASMPCEKGFDTPEMAGFTPGEQGIMAARADATMAKAWVPAPTADGRFEQIKAEAVEHLSIIRAYLKKNSRAGIERDWADVGTMAHYAAKIKEIHDEMMNEGEYK